MAAAKVKSGLSLPANVELVPDALAAIYGTRFPLAFFSCAALQPARLEHGI